MSYCMYHVHHVVHYEIISRAIVACTHVYHVVHYTYQHMPCLVAIGTHLHHVVYYTYQHMPCLVAIVACTHLHHVVHYTYQHMPCLVAIGTHVHHGVRYTSTHAMSCCYWYLCTPQRPLHINTCHVLLLLLHAPIYTTSSTTHINTCHVLLLLLHAPIYTTSSTTHINTCHVLLLLVPMYTTASATHQHMPCLVAIGTHVHHGVRYTSTHAMSCCYWYPCTPRRPLHINTCHVLLLLLHAPIYTMSSTTHINTCHVLLHVPCTPRCPLHISTHAMSCCYCCMSCCYCCMYHLHHVVHYEIIISRAIVDTNHLGSATASFGDLVHFFNLNLHFLIFFNFFVICSNTTISIYSNMCKASQKAVEGYSWSQS